MRVGSKGRGGRRRGRQLANRHTPQHQQQPHEQLPPELAEEGEEDEAVRVEIGVKRPVPLTQEEATARFNRYKR